MTTHGTDSRTWIRKARALLLPSPFAAIDQAGEAERQKRLQQYLAERFQDALGAIEAESEVEATARLQAAGDAYESESHVQADPPREQPVPVPLKHPLSANALPTVYSRVKPDQVRDDFELFLQGLPTQSTDLEKFIRELWLAVMTAHNSAKEPLSLLPGSVLMPDHSVLAHRSLTAALHGSRSEGEAALLYLHVGPVQSFIQAARRTDDLWSGSFTVAFLTYRGVEKVAEMVGPDALVFPDLAQLPLSQKRLFGKAPDKESLTHSSLANKFLAIVPRARAEEIAQAATEAIRDEWKTMAREAKRELNRALQGITGFIDPWRKWDEQIESHLEMDVVIQPWPQDMAKLSQFIVGSGLQLPVGPLPVDAAGTQRIDRNRQVGAFYGCLFDHSHRLMAAHRLEQTPQSAVGDSRPKCVQCVRREQMGPISENASSQQHLSRTFFTKLSKALQENARGMHEQSDGQDDQDDQDDRHSLQLSAGEGLCAVCLVKRLLPKVYYGKKSGEGTQLDIHWDDAEERRLLRFPSVSALATAPVRYVLAAKLSGVWESTEDERNTLRRQIREWKGTLDTLQNQERLDFTHPGNLLPGLRKWPQSDSVRNKLLKIDGSWFYQDFYVFDTVWRSHFPDRTAPDERRSQVSAGLGQARKALSGILATADCQPSTYLAVLCADVDKMGKWLTGRNAPLWKDIAAAELLRPGLEDKRRPLYPALGADLSRRLGTLATKTFLEIVETKCLGRVVYSGGDDLLAFLPLQTALHCLNLLNQAIRKEEHLGSKVTLSAGLHIMHWRDPLTRAIESARKAEERAKHLNGNRFAISLHKRSGTASLFDLPWELQTPSVSKTSTRNSIDALLALLGHGFKEQSDSKDQAATRAAQAAYELEIELLPLLAGSDDSPPSVMVLDALFDRTRVLCGFARDEPWPGQPFLWEGIPERARPEEVRKLRSQNLKRFIDVLLFVRFLQREERGLKTGELLSKLPQEKTP